MHGFPEAPVAWNEATVALGAAGVLPLPGGGEMRVSRRSFCSLLVRCGMYLLTLTPAGQSRKTFAMFQHGAREAGRAAAMNEDQFNLSVRKFLKEVGVTSQRVIENAVLDAVKSGRLAGNEMLGARMTLEVEGIAIRHVTPTAAPTA